MPGYCINVERRVENESLNLCGRNEPVLLHISQCAVEMATFRPRQPVPSLRVQQATLTHVGGIPRDCINIERQVGTELESLWGPFCVVFVQKSQCALEMATFGPDDLFRVYASNRRHSLTSVGCLETVSTLSAEWGLSC